MPCSDPRPLRPEPVVSLPLPHPYQPREVDPVEKSADKGTMQASVNRTSSVLQRLPRSWKCRGAAGTLAGLSQFDSERVQWTAGLDAGGPGPPPGHGHGMAVSNDTLWLFGGANSFGEWAVGEGSGMG